VGFDDRVRSAEEAGGTGTYRVVATLAGISARSAAVRSR
jgi:hypothetical protein